jgi:hypothetical protein
VHLLTLLGFYLELACDSREHEARVVGIAKAPLHDNPVQVSGKLHNVTLH